MIGITPAAVHLQGKKLSCTTKLAVTNNLFCIVNRYLSNTLNQYDKTHNNSNQNSNFNNEDQ